jgi:hypothetical protein
MELCTAKADCWAARMRRPAQMRADYGDRRARQEPEERHVPKAGAACPAEAACRRAGESAADRRSLQQKRRHSPGSAGPARHLAASRGLGREPATPSRAEAAQAARQRYAGEIPITGSARAETQARSPPRSPPADRDGDPPADRPASPQRDGAPACGSTTPVSCPDRTCAYYTETLRKGQAARCMEQETALRGHRQDCWQRRTRKAV